MSIETAAYHVSHRTAYAYTSPVSLCHNEVHLRPRELPWQQPSNHVLDVVPQPAVINHGIDYFGNHVDFFSVQEPHRALEVHSSFEVHLSDPGHPDAADTPPIAELLRQLSADVRPEALDARQYLYDSPFIRPFDEIEEFVRASAAPGRPALAIAEEISTRIHDEFEYDPRATTIATPLGDVLRQRRGVCQDFAHLAIACLRALGLPARYVSGYIRTHGLKDGSRLQGADASHAWVSVFVGDGRWVDLDPTNNKRAGLEHVCIGWGRDYGDVSPIKGVILGGGQQTLDVQVTVAPIEPASTIVREDD